MNEDSCYEAATSTLSQAEDSLWHRLRFGRITTSKLHAGTFVQQVIGAAKVRETKAMERGRKLEKEVLNFFGDHVVEVKRPSTRKAIGYYLTTDGKIAAKYKAQVQLQMHILKKKSCIFVVTDPEFEQNKKLTNISIPYDKNYIQEVMLNAEKFWKMCISCIIPVWY
ncbi:hypothetical protein RN001_003785 [Aquatica leii]|uniref:YqaJ viral recombinase domain-containing protein n=1 Tax=Aquatica leii TaxID=1421715 RepID=A0AAN7PIU5_9COLE|nr:hypothetical protein RN001_003785 [Aquatica leii]